MFGYVVVNERELKIKDYETYRAFYCGICESLGRYGLSGKATLSNDMVLLAMLLTDLYDGVDAARRRRCPLHPVRARDRIRNEFVDYAADMTVLLSYYYCMDHWNDEKNPFMRAGAGILRRKMRRVARKWPGQAQAVEDYIAGQTEAEAAAELDPESMAAFTGKALAEIFAFRDDEWAPLLRTVGSYLGKYIYLMDAYDDVERDMRRGQYNPFAEMSGEEDFALRAKEIMTADMAECAEAFERLPLVKYEPIISNILYSGVWMHYDRISERRRQRAEKRSGEDKGVKTDE